MGVEKQSKGIKGGKREGAGRKAGVPNKRTAEIQKAVEESGQTPLDYMLSVMRDAEQDEFRRLQAANMAAPYVHAKLSSVDATLSGKNGENLFSGITVEFINRDDSEVS
jgi:hypothetical protein